ncbi:MAG: alpha/beta hydrolase [Planctomycetaceae bacterium]|nr:alpha/beta hydrolase [Planctomycetaceae bacterium]
MPTEPLSRKQKIQRWLLLIAVTMIATVIVRSQVASNAEAFWVLFPLSLISATYGLHLFPFPQLASQSPFARRVIKVVLIGFPVLFYGFLVYVTNSVWSWIEAALCVYFFGFSLECFLLVFFKAASWVEHYVAQRLAVRWRWCALVGEKAAVYAILVPFLLVVFAVHRPKLIPRRLTDPAIQTVELISFSARDGLPLRGVFLPRPNAIGTIIVCHGVGANHADIQPLFLNLYHAGFQILAFDFRGHGNSAGHTITYGLQERRDVLGAYDYCVQRSDVDRTRLFALGASMGGAALLQALPEMPQVRAAVVDSAFASLDQMAGHQLRFFPPVVRAPLVQLVRWFAWIETGADLQRLSPADRLREISIPLLIIHGSDDTVVPVEHAHLLQKAATGPVQLRIEPGAPHIGSVVFDPTGYVQRVKAHFLSAVH